MSEKVTTPFAFVTATCGTAAVFVEMSSTNAFGSGSPDVVLTRARRFVAGGRGLSAMVCGTPGGSVSCSSAGWYPRASTASVPPAVPTPSSSASPAAVAIASTRPPLPVHVIVAPASAWFVLSALTTRTGRNPSGMATATSRWSDGTSTCRTNVELAR